MKIKYPTRCRIIDAEAIGYKAGPFYARTPRESKPHIGKEGIAERLEDSEDEGVKIVLDDGSILYGSECWWEPLGGGEAMKDSRLETCPWCDGDGKGIDGTGDCSFCGG